MKRNSLAVLLALPFLAACGNGRTAQQEAAVEKEATVQEETTAATEGPAITEEALVSEAQSSTKEQAEAPDDGRPRMLLVEGGTFQLGDDRSGFHDVTVSGFEMGVTELTVEQYKSVMGGNFSEAVYLLPAGGINWFEALVICNRLSELYGYAPCYSISGETDPGAWGEEIPYFTESSGNVGDMTLWNTVRCDFNADGYRLPTLAEWLFAARGGNRSRGYTYSGSDRLDEVGWYNGNAEIPMEVAQKKPNELGLYDMSGNEWEWCWDWSGPYSKEAEVNPTGPSEGTGYRVRCGGGVGTPAEYAEVQQHSGSAPNESYFGLRLCRSVGSR